MAIDLNRTWLLANTTRQFNLSGRVITLGVQDLFGEIELRRKTLAQFGFELHPSHSPLKSLGFEVEALDISAFEGADHIYDLGSDYVGEDLKGKYDVVYTGGTLEHVFDIRQSLKNIFELLKPNGTIIHAGPANGWLEHGFYQFSPTFFTDYYAANGFEILEVKLLQQNPVGEGRIIHSYVPGIWDGIAAGSLDGLWNFHITVRRTPSASWDKKPTQRFYSIIHDETDALSPFVKLEYELPFLLLAGEKYPLPMKEIKLENIAASEGFELMARLDGYSELSAVNGKLSPIWLLEDGKLIGPPNTLREDIIKKGKGRYLHWGDWLLFSSSDNQDHQGRTYSCLVPSPNSNADGRN